MRERQKGQAVVEMIGNVIIFSIMIALVATLSLYLYLQHLVATAARDGARFGAINSSFASGDDATGIAAVEQRVTDFMLQAAGQELDASNSTITVTPPDDAGTPGQRTVSVAITYNFQNPVAIGSFIETLTGTPHDDLDQFPVTAQASMRFEE